MNDSYPPVSLVGNEWTASYSIKQWNYVVSPCWRGLPTNIFHWKCGTAIQNSLLCLDWQWGGESSESLPSTGWSRVWLAHFYPETPYQVRFDESRIEMNISCWSSVQNRLSRMGSTDVTGMVLIFPGDSASRHVGFESWSTWYPCGLARKTKMADLHYPVQAETKYSRAEWFQPCTNRSSLAYNSCDVEQASTFKIEQESVPTKTDGQANEKRPTIDRKMNGFVGYAGNRSWWSSTLRMLLLFQNWVRRIR